jgi:hypothetical protein
LGEPSGRSGGSTGEPSDRSGGSSEEVGVSAAAARLNGAGLKDAELKGARYEPNMKELIEVEEPRRLSPDALTLLVQILVDHVDNRLFCHDEVEEESIFYYQHYN